MNSQIFVDEILKTLSFFEPMSLEFIFLDLDPNFVKENNKITYDDLLNVLTELESQKRIIIIQDNSQKKWIKLFPKKPWYKKLFP
ncbi:MAG: hypothetical protein HON90_13815 [Halobacteriovoraceae bacterium]|jgi:hypothetical protein|nr:hypothetical protein [Halobacteriovoraceae bacterium]